MNVQKERIHAEGEQFLIMQAASATEFSSHDDGSGAAILKEWQAGPAAALADKQLQSNGSTTARRLSADQSHEDFEFNKVVGMMQATTIGDKEGEYKHQLEMPSADELFYKGQLLPLAVQYKSNMQEAWANQQYLHLHDDSATSKSSNYTAINATATASPPTQNNISAADGDPFESFPSQLVSREQDVRFSSSCRMELGQKHQLDSILSPPSSLFDLRCSSFSSHSSKYSSYYCHYYANYGSSSNCSTNGDSSITVGESSSSSCSRDSNGSSQDSAAAAAPGPDAPAAACSTSYPSSDFLNMSRDHHLCCSSSCSCSCCHAPLQYGPKRKPLGFLQSWRLFLLHGLKTRGTSSAYDDHHQAHHNPISCKAHNTVHVGGLQQRAAAAAANSSFSAELSMYKNTNRGLSASSTFACKSQDSRRGTCIRNTNYDGCKPRSTGLMEKQSGVKLKDQGRSDHKQSAPSSEVKRASCAINGGTSNISCSSKGSKWQRWIKPNLSTIKARLVGANQLEKAKEDQEEEEESGWSTTKRRVTRKQPSLDRKFSQTSLCDGVGLKELSNLQPSFRFHAGGSAATSSSCPASVRSSPNHSGLLSPAPPTSSISNMSSMQELHSAVQGAIAHCKQSNSAPFLMAPPPPPS
ncbi:hypothetical protein L7F22_004917 [Adiantum nelumboides]|nr:hypothetical protein [Adiantum nelumboides]